jgi:toxic protein SymE
MANANHKARPRRKERPVATQTTLLDSPDWHNVEENRREQPFIPWMKIADLWLQTAGFEPGQRVCISVDYSYQRLTITPDIC